MQAKKSLGQNFLKSKSAIREIIAAAKITDGDTILEVGPGRGVLTEELLKKARKVIAVEKDERLVEFLRNKFPQELKNGKLEIVTGDILDLDPKRYTLHVSSYKIVANIPYYITGQFLRKFLTNDIQPTTIAVMLQKEVAKRIVANDKKESLLSISVKVYGTPKYIGTVPSRYFTPEPKVDSAIITIENINKDFFKDIDEKKFFEILHAGFAHKRKVLVNNLKTLMDSKNLATIFSNCNFDKNIRAENLTAKSWHSLCLNILA